MSIEHHLNMNFIINELFIYTSQDSALRYYIPSSNTGQGEYVGDMYNTHISS